MYHTCRMQLQITATNMVHHGAQEDDLISLEGHSLSLCSISGAWCKHEMLQVVVYLQISPMPCRPVQIARVRLCVCVLVYICPRSAVHDCQEKEKINAGHRRYFSVRALFCLLFCGRTTAVGTHSVRSLIERLCDREYKINLCPFDSRSVGEHFLLCGLAEAWILQATFCPLDCSVEILLSCLPFFPTILLCIWAPFEWCLLCVQASLRNIGCKRRARYKVALLSTDAQIMCEGLCGVTHWGWNIFRALWDQSYSMAKYAHSTFIQFHSKGHLKWNKQANTEPSKRLYWFVIFSYLGSTSDYFYFGFVP